MPITADDVKVQKAVWQLELGRGKIWIQWGAAILLAVALSLVYIANQFRGLERAEAMDMAQLARNIARGQGYTTYVIRPLSLWQLQEHSRDHQPRLMNHPDLVNPPLYPLVLAALFKLVPASVFDYSMNEPIFKPERWIIVPFNQLCLFLSLLLVYFWARQLFDQRVAVTAAFALLFSDTLWFFSISGLPTSFLMLLFLLSLFCLWLADRRWHPEPTETAPGHGWLNWLLVLASAGLLGLCFLTRYSMAFLLLPMGVYAGCVCRGRGPWRVVAGVVLYVLVFGAVITPWLVRNLSLCGAPLGIVYSEFAHGITYAQLKPDFERAFEIGPMGTRLLNQSRFYLLDAFKDMGASFLVFFFVVSLMYGFKRSETMRLRRVVWGGLLCVIFGMSCILIPYDETEGPRRFVTGGNLLVLFLPLVTVYGTAFFYLLLDRIAFPARLLRLGVIGLFLGVNAAALIYSLLPPRRGPYPYPPYCAYYTKLAANWFESDEVGASDLPWSIAWVGDRRTVWLPKTADDLVMIHDHVAPKGLSFILLTPRLLNGRFQSDLTKGEYKAWFAVISGRLPANFPLKIATLYAPAGEQILYADRARWADKKIGEPPSREKKPKKTDEK